MDNPDQTEFVTFEATVDEYNRMRRALRLAERHDDQDRDVQTEFGGALDHLFTQATGDHGGSRRCAAFLLSLWDSTKYRVGLVDIFYVDELSRKSMIRVLTYLHDYGLQLESVVTQKRMASLIRNWRTVASG